MSVRAVAVMRTVALVGLASGAADAQSRRGHPPPPPPLALREDGCPEVPPPEGARCVERAWCTYPPHTMRGTQCVCDVLPRGARHAWHCSPYVFQGVGPLAPPELLA